MEKVDIKLKHTAFPSQFVSKEEKDSWEFGLQVGNAIAYEWFRRDSAGPSRFYSQWSEFNRRRLYSRAEQSVQKYKNELAVDGDLSWTNVDWTPVPIIPKFVDIMVNGFTDRMFKPKAIGQDAKSQEKRKRWQDNIEAEMVAKPFLEKIQEYSGVNPFTTNPEELPRNEEEFSLYKEMNYKAASEIAEETAIQAIMDENDYYELLKRVYRDITVLGIGVAKHNFWPGFGVKQEYVDPENFVYSYTDHPDFRDCFYFGEVKSMPVVDLVEIDPDLTESDLEEISKYSQSWWDYHNLGKYYDDSVFSRDTATLLFFNYKTVKKVKYKKKITSRGGAKIIEKDDTFNPPTELLEEGRFEVIEKTIETWYEGIMVLGTDIMLSWGEMKNMVRPKSSSQHATPSYIAYAPDMYNGNIRSITERMIPDADIIQMVHIKMQQVIARTVPDGIFIDADGLNEVDLGNGAKYDPNEALKLYFQTGSVVGRSFTGDGEFNHGKVPIQELRKASGQDKLAMLIGAYNHYLQNIRNVTGLNEARDGSDPDPRSLVGLQKLAALNSNTATRHILDAGLYITKKMAQATSLRIADILEYDEFREDFINKIGRHNVDMLEEFKDLYLYDFNIIIEVAPDEEEKAELKENIQVALSKGDINLEDAIDVREIKNIKLANQLLKMKRIRKQEHDDQMAMQAQQMQSQTQMQSQQMAAQAAQAKIEAETNGKIKVKQAETAFDIERMKAEAQLKRELMEEEFLYNMKLKGDEAAALSDREKYKEDEKARRIDRQSSQQSELIEQRQKGLPPKNFESTEDTLDGFSLESFGPR